MYQQDFMEFSVVPYTFFFQNSILNFLFAFRSGGYKISALHIERLLLAHPDIKDIAIVGIDDPTWGQVLGAVIVPDPNQGISLDKVKFMILFHSRFYNSFYFTDSSLGPRQDAQVLDA